MYNKEETRRFLATRVARPASAGVIIENEHGEALVLKAHYKPYWSFPGGWIEHGQTPRAAAVRELREETGIKREVDQIEFSFVIARRSDIMQTYQFIFHAKESITNSTSLELQEDEIAAAKFVTKQYVKTHDEEFGGAVNSWAVGAENNFPGYYEQQI